MLNGLKEEINNPRSMFNTKRITVIIIVVFFIIAYIWGGIGGTGGGIADASSGTDLRGAQFDIPAVQTNVSPVI